MLVIGATAILFHGEIIVVKRLTAVLHRYFRIGIFFIHCIGNGLCAVLKKDAKIRADAFTPQFTAEKFAEVLFSLMLSALLQQNYDPSAVLEIIRRTLYS